MFLRALHRFLRFEMQLRAFAQWRDEELWQKAVAIGRVSAFAPRDVYDAFALYRSAGYRDVSEDEFLAVAHRLLEHGYGCSAASEALRVCAMASTSGSHRWRAR